MRKRLILIFWFSALLLSIPHKSVYTMPFSKHAPLTRVYVGGITTSALKTIHSSIIDHVPWWSHPGGGDTHRRYWGHSDDWYRSGKIPKDAVKDVAQRRGVSTDEARKIIKKEYFQGYSSGRDFIAGKIRKTFPYLTNEESLALADQLFESHRYGDHISDFEKEKRSARPRTPRVLRNPPVEALQAQFKISADEAAKKGIAPEKFSGQAVNFESWKVMKMAQENNLKIYNPDIKNHMGVKHDGRNLVYASTKARAVKLISNGESCVVPDDVYDKMTKRILD